MNQNEKLDEVILLTNPETEVADVLRLPKNKVRIALPTVCRRVKDFDKIISKLLDAGYKKWEIGNYWGLSVLPIKKIDMSFDNMIYMFNCHALQMAKDMRVSRATLAVEDTLSNMENLANNSPLPIAVVVYQDVPLFTSAVCIRDNACKDCSTKPLWIKLEKDGNKYEALSKDCSLMMFYHQIKEENAAITLKDLAINGHDLMEKFDIKPSPLFGKILNGLLELVLDEKIENNKEVLLLEAASILEKEKDC